MCVGEAGGGHRPVGPLPMTRRRFLVASTLAGGALAVGRIRPAAAASVDLGGVAVIPRAAWGGDLPPAGPLHPEPDVRFLLVHHSVDPGNDYAEADVPGILRTFVRFHTADKGWPDLAYNFLVDRFGRVWEGRTGSLAGPVAGDATGGNQGFDQLCCFIGNHQAADPSAPAFAAMGRLLGGLGRRYGVDLSPGATVTFASRGSNRHPAGTVVTAATVAGHRDMSRTQCPGDLVYACLGELRAAASGGAVNRPAPTTTAPPPPPSTTAAPATNPPSSAPPVSAAPTASRAAARSSDGGRGGTGPAAVVAGAATATAAAAAAGAVRRRRQHGTEGRPPSQG
ncbi:MAG TPA: N-acetylmuramoyl-L-alanine amidase [Acidimicrobiales bacterium]|nr:N-acetylmuramoyl-L-alanine amidase [Acidimicrobiales bacterium]